MNASTVYFHGTTEETRDEAEKSASEVIDHVNEILGYDVLETSRIEADTDLRERATARLSTAGDHIPAEDVLGRLDEQE
jgi:hypothetical protein